MEEAIWLEGHYREENNHLLRTNVIFILGLLIIYEEIEQLSLSNATLEDGLRECSSRPLNTSFVESKSMPEGTWRGYDTCSFSTILR